MGFEAWNWKRMFKIKWNDQLTNEVFRKVGEERDNLKPLI